MSGGYHGVANPPAQWIRTAGGERDEVGDFVETVTRVYSCKEQRQTHVRQQIYPFTCCMVFRGHPRYLAGWPDISIARRRDVEMTDKQRKLLKAAIVGATVGMLLALPMWLLSGGLQHTLDGISCSEGASSGCSLIWLLAIPVGVLYFFSQLIAPLLATPWPLLLSGVASRHTAIVIGAALNCGLVALAVQYVQMARRAN